ncbi:MAG: TetR family transcriptional regulator [uncultured Thiotrichaceae bacterium]|uniref:TetR family transcriptional regulator n=1 Tax=uncultured Thiotrichaceae bacterium TaxID=298394 RepID=A0A6S6T1I7_9GAMM|nr:MAG: TetR family transcriptional regulator [uncultured Thiotrichaceae bacterium]
MKSAWWHAWRCNRCDTERASEETRRTLLLASFEEIHRCGFQASSLQNILKNTKLTKGALYHHFRNKQDIGYAVVDEILKDFIHEQWIKPLAQTNDPIQTLKEIMQYTGEQMTQEDIELGCPLNNLSQEMSSIDDGFRHRIEGLYQDWRVAIADALESGKARQLVREDVNTKQFAIVFVATLEGCIGMAKSSQDMEILQECGMGLMDLLETLR